jgi:hypothetical protein
VFEDSGIFTKNSEIGEEIKRDVMGGNWKP